MYGDRIPEIEIPDRDVTGQPSSSSRPSRETVVPNWNLNLVDQPLIPNGLNQVRWLLATIPIFGSIIPIWLCSTLGCCWLPRPRVYMVIVGRIKQASVLDQGYSGI